VFIKYIIIKYIDDVYSGYKSEITLYLHVGKYYYIDFLLYASLRARSAEFIIV